MWGHLQHQMPSLSCRMYRRNREETSRFQVSNFLAREEYTSLHWLGQGPVNQRVDNVIKRKNINKTKHTIRWIGVYPADSVIHSINNLVRYKGLWPGKAPSVSQNPRGHPSTAPADHRPWQGLQLPSNLQSDRAASSPKRGNIILIASVKRA